MSQQLLQGPDIRPALQQMRRKRVPQRVGVDLAPETCRHGRSSDGGPGRLPSQPHAAAGQEQRLAAREQAEALVDVGHQHEIEEAVLVLEQEEDDAVGASRPLPRHRESRDRDGRAVRETIDFITGKFPHLTREEAYMIASVAVDYHVTQVVDGTKGIHGMIPKSIFKP